MTDTGQIPGEGQPAHAGAQPEPQPGTPAASGAYTFEDPQVSTSGMSGEEEDLLMPGAQGAWGDTQLVPGAPHQTRPVGTHETDGRNTGTLDYRAVRMPQPDTPAAGVPADGAAAGGGYGAHPGATPAAGTPAASAPVSGGHGTGTPAAGTPVVGTPAGGTPVGGTPAAGTPAAGTPVAMVNGAQPSGAEDGAAPAEKESAQQRRPLHLGPPVPEQSGAVRSLADRGPSAPAPPAADGTHQQQHQQQPQPQSGAAAPGAADPSPVAQPGLPVTGLEYLDIAEQGPDSLPGPQLGEIPSQPDVWSVQSSQAAAEETAKPATSHPATSLPGPELAAIPGPSAPVDPYPSPESRDVPAAPAPVPATPEPQPSGPQSEAADAAPVPSAPEPAPEASAPDASAPDASAPDASAPDASAPDAPGADGGSEVAGPQVVPADAETAPAAQPEPVRAEPVQPEPVQSEPVQPEAVPLEAAQAGPAQSQPVRPEPVPVPVPVQSEPVPPEPGTDTQQPDPAAAQPPSGEVQPPAAPEAPLVDVVAEEIPEPVREPVPEAADGGPPAPAAKHAAAPATPAVAAEAVTPDAATPPVEQAEPTEPTAAAQPAAPATEETPAPPDASTPPLPEPAAQAAPEQTADAAPPVAVPPGMPVSATDPVPSISGDGPAAEAASSTGGEPETRASAPAGPESLPEAPATPEAPAAPETPQSPAAPGYDEAEREAVHRLMRERRDIRKGFRSDPIPHEVLLRVLEAAHTAPSVGHSQPWDFVVIRSEETRRTMHELAQRQREVYAKSLPKARAKQFKELKIEAILDTPVNIVVTADSTRGGRHTLGRHTQPQMAPYSSALAVENLWLAARAEGLGVGWVSFFDEKEMVRALDLPKHLDVVAYLCIGYVDEFPDEPELMQAGWSKRRPLSWVVHEESYGRRVLPGAEPHDLLAETLERIRPLDAKALGEAWERQKRMTKPAGALGMLEIISAQLCGLSRQCPPPIPEPAAVAVFAGDHGVHAQGVTSWPQEVTAQMVTNFLNGGAVVNAFASQVGAEVCVIDVGVAGELPASPGLMPRKVRPGTADMTQGPALTPDEVLRAIEVGIETARDLVAAGNKALLTGEMGIANTTASAALIAACTGADPAEVTGRGTGISDETHARKVEVIRRALQLHRPDPSDPLGMLAAIGGLEHAALTGLILGAASLRTPVILDGVSAGAAALIARLIAPEALAACIAGHRSAEPGHVAALTKLGLRPLIDLDLRLGEGTGALLALPMVQSTARAMHEVATFDSAGVTEKN
ncbi:nicotinate-nucleotide--dimethylbenzimidazole phosphoribosyltransferase [Streptomyces sp. N2-109]|uniref:Nicotinate-nucleotide--dimethylbenzimidazole phosphoribosyltransferase n=1 Tax=Streptomyces gossypii TaxID=2883101 RepID=A0ABT2JL71_9ACTN|nr:nicotinate-nucleotide--dimethylbenzimidazole phosphoribosyltransferase [Streptomyces gossypii]MCT2588621.1 nicotinate-nucleotide--dimethylbenzimidazole phosphoribosyltransferase [Streptomyces gossypii]